MKRMVLLLIIVLSSIAYAEEENVLPKPDVLGKEEIFTSVKLSAYSAVVVKDFTTAGAEYTNLDEEEKKIVDEIKPQLVKNLTESIVKQLKKEGAFPTVTSNTSAKGNVIIVKGKFTRFNGGQGAAKFFLGFMAPEGAKTNIAVSGQLVDAKSGKVLASFSDTRSGGEGGSLGRIRGVMPIQAKDEGEEIANFIIKLAK